MSTERKTHPLVLALALVLVCVGLSLALLAMAFPDPFGEYRRYLTESRPALDFRFDELSELWTEADVRQQFPLVPFKCGKVPAEMDLGEWGCRTEISSHNGVRAMGLSFFFREGRLDSASLQVPWWHHQKGLRSILTLYGRPIGFQSGRRVGVRLVGWHLANGSALFYNRDLEWNPLSWSALYWVSQRRCKQQRCELEVPVGGL